MGWLYALLGVYCIALLITAIYTIDVVPVVRCKETGAFIVPEGWKEGSIELD